MLPLFAALAVTLLELLDATASINQLLLARVEGMALVAEFRGELGLRGARGEGVPTGTLHGRFDVVGMDVGLHGSAPGRFRDSQVWRAGTRTAISALEPVQDRGLALGHLGQELVIGAERAQSVDQHFKARTSTSTLGKSSEDPTELMDLLELLGVIEQFLVTS